MLREVVSNELLTILLMASIALLAISKMMFSGRFTDFITLVGNSKYLKIYSRDQKFLDVFDAILFVNLLISLSVFFVVIFRSYLDGFSVNLETVLKLIAGLGSILLIKVLIERLLGSLFEIDSLIDDYLFQKTSYKNYIGIALIPINTLLIYSINPSKTAIYSIIVLLVIINLIGLTISFKNHQNLILNNLFYFILYLCALEISPYIILYKVLA